MLLSDEQILKLQEAIVVADRRLATTTLSDDQRKVFQNAKTNAQNRLLEHAASQKKQGQQKPEQMQSQEHRKTTPMDQASATSARPTPTAQIEVEIKTPANRVPHQQMVVVEAKEGGDIALHLPAVSGSTITITTPDGEKKKLTLGQAFTRLRSLIRERLLGMKKLLTTSKCFFMAVTLYGGLCLAMKKELTAKDVFAKTVSKQTKTVFSEVAAAWKKQKT